MILFPVQWTTKFRSNFISLALHRVFFFLWTWFVSHLYSFVFRFIYPAQPQQQEQQTIRVCVHVYLGVCIIFTESRGENSGIRNFW